MNITGGATLHAPPPQVWTALNDPAVLTSTIPGCEHLEAAGPASYRLTITAAVASIQGIYTTEISLTDRQEPASCRLALNAVGAPGTLNASVLVMLVPSGNGSTEVTYAADAKPDGMIAAVGQRLLASTAQKLASDFFASIDELLVSGAAAVSATGGVGEPRPPRPHTGSFLQGALAGAAATLAGLGVARLLGRRSR